MKTLRILSVIVVAAAPVLVGTAAHAVGSQTQTVTFDAPPPTGLIYDRNDFGIYVNPTASSGLPVTVTIDDASTAACGVLPGGLGHDPEEGGVTIYTNSPGTCIVNADQPGDDQYAPAHASQTWTVLGEESHLAPARVNKGVFGLTPSVFKATLTTAQRFGPGFIDAPYAGQKITFKVAGKAVCTATTNAKGVGTCNAKIGAAAAGKQKTYTVSFAGDRYHQPTTATGVLFSLVG